jgi:hypothetical protein
MAMSGALGMVDAVVDSFVPVLPLLSPSFV